MRVSEVPLYMAHVHSVSVNLGTVYGWMKAGRLGKDETRIYLIGGRKMGRTYIRRADLEAFVGAW